MNAQKSAGTADSKQPKSAPITKSPVECIKGSTNILIIAPHGRNIRKMDDKKTDIVALEIANQLGCSALINDSISRDTTNYNDKADAESDQEFITNLKSVLDADGPTLVLWVHGFDKKKMADLKKQSNLKHNESLDCLIGYGQPDRHTADQGLIDSLIEVFKEQGVSAYRALTTGPQSGYCGHELSNMNQWCRQQKKYNDKTKVQSIQLEFKEVGFRDREDNAKQLGAKVAKAVKALVRPEIVETIEGKPINPEADDQIVQDAFDFIAKTFHRHFHNAMVDVGKYIINNFYGKDPLTAFVKNKAKDQPINLKKLIEKLKEASGKPEGEAPSLSWFYNAVNLACHEMICERMGFQTFGMLGHSHKLQLLHYPKLKAVNSGDKEAVVKPTFEEKEQLASFAIENKLSVRDFKRHISGLHPSDKIDLLDLPSMGELRKRDPHELTKLARKAEQKLEDTKAKVQAYEKSIKQLNVLLEGSKKPDR